MQAWKVATYLIFTVFLLNASNVRCDSEEEDSEEIPDVEEAENSEEEDTDEDYVDVEEENDVLVLTDSNFDEVVYTKDLILVEFYAPWCGHCKQLAPEYEKAATELKQNDPPVPLAKVDATTETGVASRFDVSGYPTLKFFKGGQAYEYEGPRSASGIVDYMKERADPDWKPPPEAVLTLTQENFTDIVEKEELMLVEFYAPWCGHCKKLAPEYEKAAKQLSESDKILLAKVDATAEMDLGRQYEVSGYPTLKVFRYGKPFEYKGERNKWGIINYMQKQKGPASTSVATLKDLKKFFAPDDITVVGFFEEESGEAWDMFNDMANSNRDEFAVAHTLDKAAREAYKANPGSLVLLHPERFHSKYEPKHHVFEIKSSSTPGDLTKFVQDHEVPLVGHMSRTTKDKRYMKHKPIVLFFFDVDWSFDHRDATQAWRKKALDIAKDYKDLTFALVDEGDFKEIFDGFGFDESGEDLNIGILAEGDNKFPMEPMEEFESDLVREFLDKYKNDELRPRLRTQKSVKKEKGPVKPVIGKTFYDVVFDQKKDVLIEFYAPWCGHCKSLEPKYKELAKKVKQEKNLVIAKMDATANEAPAEYKLEGFPTIYFAPAGDLNSKKKPFKYDGEREVEAMLNFIKEKSVASFQPPPEPPKIEPEEPVPKFDDEL